MNDLAGGNVRHPVWHGMQEVSALWFPSGWLLAAERESRMLTAWLPGCRAWRFALGDVLVMPYPRIARCESLPGQALCRIFGNLYSGPVSAREVADLPTADIGLVLGAQLIALRFSDAQMLDLSESIEIGDYALHDTYECRVVVSKKIPKLDGTSVRKLLGDSIPPSSKASEEFLASLSGKRASIQDGRTGKQLGGRLAGGIAGAFNSMLFRALPFLAFFARPTTGNVGAHSIVARQNPVLPQGWRAALARLALITRVSKLIGYRQGAYLRRMMRMFEDGNLDEALRNALPLDGLGQALGQALSTPGRRDNLNLASNLGAAAHIGLGEDLQAQLRQIYRRAFETYDRQGRVDEAVFVLAELLNARQEALDYLARHGRISQAAELALGWDMPSGTIIQLLMLAGDSQRAVQVARRDGAFSAAIQSLQSSHPALADQLRLEWGHALIANGDWLGAVEAVWPLPHAREQATEWLLAAERAGDELGARALVQRAALLPDTLERYAATIEALSDPRSSEDARTAMAEALIAISGKGPALRALATHLLPAVSADRAAARNAFTRKELDALLMLSGDAYLKADMPPWDLAKAVEPVELWKRSTPLELNAPSPGLHAIYDALALPGGRYLVALGETGVAILDASGKTRQRYAVPAYRLVGSDLGHVALATAPRERVTRVSRLDLVAHAITDLGVLPLSFAARSFNGIGWTVISEQRILVLDTGSPSCDPLWHVGDLGGNILAAGFFAEREIYLVNGPHGWSDWSYAIPSRRLLARTEFKVDDSLPLLTHPVATALQPEVRLVDGRAELRYRIKSIELKCALRDTPVDAKFSISFVSLDRGLVVALQFDNHIDYFVVAIPGNSVVARVRWPRATPAQVSEHLRQIVFHDSEGRLLHLDSSNSASRHISCR